MKQSVWMSLVFGVFVVFCLTALRISDGYIAETARNLTFDQYQRIKPRHSGNQPVRVIDIDEVSLSKIGQFPWPRSEFAALVDRLKQLGAAAIAFDIVFSEPDRLSPNRVLKRDDLRQWLANGNNGQNAITLPDNDAIFAKSIAAAPVVLAFGRNARGLSETPPLKSGFAFTGNNTLQAMYEIGNTTRLLKILSDAASGAGSISLTPVGDSDVVRRYPLMWQHKGKPFPALVMETLRVAQGASTYIVKGASNAEAIVEQIKIGAIATPTTRHGELWLYYAPNRSDLYIPAHKLLRADIAETEKLRSRIEGHIVFIGTSATGLLDIKTTALGENVPGVSIHAQAVDQILSQTFLWRPDWANGVEILAVAAVGLLIVLLSVFFSPAVSLAAGLVLAAGLLAGSWFGFSQYRLLFDASFPVFAGLVTLFAMTVYRYLVTDREARFVRSAFSKYVSPDILADIQAQPDALKLGGDTRLLTIMFVDIRNFTPLSENLSPQQLVAFLNRLLGELSTCVTDQGGTIDKYLGDSIMAFWNAPLETPDHQLRACQAALAMRKTMQRLNAEDAFGFRKAGYDFANIAIGIGINTGDACVGNLGSAERFDYSIVGDAVNVAARMETACKEVGTDIIVSASTASAVAGLSPQDAGKVSLKGKSEKQQIFTLPAT